MLAAFRMASLVHIGRAKGDVVLDRAEEQAAVLQHAAQIVPQIRRVDLPHVGAVNEHGALVGS